MNFNICHVQMESLCPRSPPRVLACGLVIHDYGWRRSRGCACVSLGDAARSRASLIARWCGFWKWHVSFPPSLYGTPVKCQMKRSDVNRRKPANINYRPECYPGPKSKELTVQKIAFRPFSRGDTCTENDFFFTRTCSFFTDKRGNPLHQWFLRVWDITKTIIFHS